MTKHDENALADPGRREAMKCLSWAGAGVLWTISGGVASSVLATGAQAQPRAGSLDFVQISDTHVGFDKAANPDTLGTMREAVAKIKALPVQPSFAIHTGDITHLSKPDEFDTADQILKGLNIPVFFTPGEHDTLDEGNGKVFLDRYGKGTWGTGWRSFDAAGVHFLGLVNTVGLNADGQGRLGPEQIAWIEKNVAHLSSSTPVVVYAHMPLFDAYVPWGWGTVDAAAALAPLRRFGSVTVLNGHIHQVIRKVEGHVSYHTAYSTAFPQPAPGTAPSPGPMKDVPADRLAGMLGVSSVAVHRGAAAKI
ncbi:MAG TPA: metallophosphoesterase, partial [Caulobacteraceae bacterium]|nr:metallophosphoesterase [Caulobacteraceae bacterium]